MSRMSSFAGYREGWIDSPTDPRLALLWPGALSYDEELEFVLNAARIQCEAFAPKLTNTTYPDVDSTEFESGFEGSIKSSRNDSVVTWTVTVTNRTGAVVANPTVLIKGIPESFRPMTPVVIELSSGAVVRMGADGALTFAWGTWDNGLTLDFTIMGSTTSSVVIPENYIAAQILQAKALLRAGVAGTDSQIGIGYEGVTVFPMDWTVKALLRPKRVVPYFGGTR